MSNRRGSVPDVRVAGAGLPVFGNEDRVAGACCIDGLDVLGEALVFYEMEDDVQ